MRNTVRNNVINILSLCVVASASIGLSACSGSQSALDAAGKEADDQAFLFWIMFFAAAILWTIMFSIFVFVTKLHPRPLSRRFAELFIVCGGIVFPVILLAILLLWTLPMMPAQRELGTGLKIRVTGEQWWWRVEYWPEGADEPVVSANEIRLPVGQRTEIELTANKVIHSFWVPSLAGKLDMFPGKLTRMALEPRKTGVFRGQCAEFCGTSHAMMAFEAVVMTQAGFSDWLASEAAPARADADTRTAEGKRGFLAQGCGACHTVRGTIARGKAGPDLTHIGSRRRIGAGMFPNTTDRLVEWIRSSKHMKPAVHMPSYLFLGEREARAIAAYLGELK